MYKVKPTFSISTHLLSAGKTSPKTPGIYVWDQINISFCNSLLTLPFVGIIIILLY